MLKTLFFLPAICLCWQLGAQSPGVPAYVEHEQRAALLRLQARNAVSARTDYDVSYYRLAVSIDPAVHYVRGEVTVYFTATTDQLDQIVLDCSESLRIDSALYHGKPVAHQAAGKNQRAFLLPGALSLNTFDSLTIAYQGDPPNNGFNAFDQRTHNGVPVVWTFSCPDNAKDWWVCKNTLDDKADSVDIIVRTPAGYRASSNGVRVAETVDGPVRTSHWKHRYPITTYLIAVAVTNYAVYSDYLVNGNDSLEILNYVYPENLADARKGTAALLPVIRLYEELYGPYPYRRERFGNTQFDWGGGMEHQTNVFVTNFERSLLAHELAHQWFGDMITCSSFTEAWLNEGFATYVTALVDERLSPPDFKTWKEGSINSVTSNPGGSVYCPDTLSAFRIYDYRLTYQKGALLLHMLRWKMGDTLFFRAVRNYLNDPSLRFAYATTADLKRHFEAVSGENLTQYFKDWFNSEGYPRYDLRWYQKPDGEVILKLNQTTSHPSVSFYPMPVQIRFVAANGKDTSLVFKHTASGQIQRITPGFTPLFVQFDPNFWILCKKTVTKDISLDLQEVPDAVLRLIPNPGRSFLRLETTLDNIDEAALFDQEGRVMLRDKPQRNAVEWDIRQLPAGLYIVEVRIGTRHLTRKFVKE